MSAQTHTTPKSSTFAIYCRLSRKKPAKPGSRAGRDTETVERQERECRDYAAVNDLPIAEHLVFVDNHYSAWKRKGAIRPAWIEMMAAVERGEVAGILVYKLDRFTRAPGDMETLIELAERRGLVIRGPLAGHIDLDTANGRREARGAANQAASESDSTSERVRGALAEIMRDGTPMGAGRQYAFEVGGVVQRPAEVAVVREVATRILAGEALQTLASDLNSRGLRTPRDGEWTGANLGRLLSHARYGGYVSHHGQIVGKISTPLLNDDGECIDRVVGEPVLDAETYDAVQALLASRRRGRRPTGRFLYTGVMTCSTCQRTMNGRKRAVPLADGTRQREYTCPIQQHGCGRTIVADRVEKIVDDHMVALLSDEDTVAAIVEKDAYLNEARAAQLSRLQAVEDRLSDLEVKWASGELIQAAYDRARPVLDGQRAKLLAGMTELSPARQIKAYDASLDWSRMTDDEKRAVVRDYGVKIEILAWQPGTNRFDPNRIVVTLPTRTA